MFSLDLSLVPRDPSLSPSLAKLEGPVADRSLTKQLAGGRASWLQVQAQGWPGAYSLTFNVTIKNDLYQVRVCWTPEAGVAVCSSRESLTSCICNGIVVVVTCCSVPTTLASGCPAGRGCGPPALPRGRGPDTCL